MELATLMQSFAEGGRVQPIHRRILLMNKSRMFQIRTVEFLIVTSCSCWFGLSAEVSRSNDCNRLHVKIKNIIMKLR
jgi:hypothetical protein